MKFGLFVVSLFASSSIWAQQATVHVSLTAGSFNGKTSDVRGFAIKKGNAFEAQNVVVGLKNLQTGISLRDTHTKKHLEVDKYPEAILVSAKGMDGKGTGVIKIKGIEQKIAGTYKIDGKDLVAEFPLKLSDFKITGIKYMGIGVDDQVQLTVTIPIK